MKQLELTSAAPTVKKFFDELVADRQALQLTLDGTVVCSLFPAVHLSDEDKRAALKRGWGLARKAQLRNRRTPTAVIRREIANAVRQVRSRSK